MVRAMLSMGILLALALSIASRSRKLVSGSPLPPSRTARAMSRLSLVNSTPRLTSLAPFWRLMVDHLEWPDIGNTSFAADAGWLAKQAQVLGMIADWCRNRWVS